eukprot:gene16737-22896_t
MSRTNYSQHQRGYNKKSMVDSDSDSDDNTRTKGDGKVTRNLNELLMKVLEDAANPGIGDEDPEVLEKEPSSMSTNGIVVKRSGEKDDNEVDDESDRPDPKQRKNEQEERNKAMVEEEKKLSELNFDSDFLNNTASYDSMKERAKYIPLRLTYEERKSLRLVNASINVSDYTTTVDVAFKNKARRHHVQIQHIVAFLSGLVAATDYNRGQEVLTNRNFVDYESLIGKMLEIARRYKITNPEKMRSEYGKLVYLMQDAVSESTRPLLGININMPIVTVYDLLEKSGGLALLDEPHLEIATQEILSDKSKNRATIQFEIKKKEKAAEHLVRKYTSNRLSSDTIRACMYSISDNNSFLNSNCKPITECIELLTKYFSNLPDGSEFSLTIVEGKDGARLSHSHQLQYNYVLQSLTLWEAIVKDMFRLWYLAEQDLLADNQPYELKNTGQGLQRVQQSPRVFRAMHEILATTKLKLGGWVGSSVIHLGDHNVPNTLVFIDKYTQVSRILGPLITTLKNLEQACEESEGLSRYLQAYGGIEKAKKDILKDFFTHAFDGSGGDNFFDAGSCIDGRLTSAWNWCSTLSSKPFYPLFRLTGFLSFDGQFEK